MSSNAIRLRTLVLRLTVILSCWLRTHHSVFAVNMTVQDTDHSIVYQPPESWHSSSDPCSSCLNPGLLASYHEVIHPDITNDEDDSSSPSTTNPPQSIESSSSNIPPPTPTADTDNDGDSDDNDGKADSDQGHSGKSKRRSIFRRFVARLDIDDPGFVDPTFTFSFNFTGTAIYIFCIQPLGVGGANDPPTNLNLTFAIDNKPSGVFTSTGLPGATGFRANTSVLSVKGLPDTAHQLVVNVGRNSSFLFDHLVYTTSQNNATSTTNNSATPMIQSTPSATINPTTKKRNVATFAGAVGGSVGVLGLFSLGLALSIIRRRRLAAIRDRRDRESLYTNGSDDSPHMSGPAPFVPRYFPGTVVPPDPPTYTAALASNDTSSTLLSSMSNAHYSSAHRSYADIPPSTPPPLLDDTVMIPPPPPFPVAIRSHPPHALPEGAHASPIPGTEETSHNAAPVGVDCSNPAIAPERVPLLQSGDNEARPRLQLPSDRPADPREVTGTNRNRQEGVS